MQRLVEIRSYKLKPDAAERFHDVFISRAIPMLRASGMDVVAFGPSVHEPQAYFLIRSYDDLAHRAAQHQAFYGSVAWRQGPREAVISLIERYLDTVFLLSAPAIEAWRADLAHQEKSPMG